MNYSSPVLSYIIINIDPVFHIGPLAIHWYGVAYVVGILAGLWAILRYAKRLGLDAEIVYSVFWWAALAGLIGGRLYFVIQQPELVSNYLEKPINIIDVTQGGMAFFGAIFLGIATVAFVAWRRKLPIWLALDIAAYFAAVGQIFGRLGNLVNGDILGYQTGTLPTMPDTCLNAPCIGFVSDPHILPWATVYVNQSSFAPPGVPYQPAVLYEMGMNLILLAILLPLLMRLPRIKAGLVSLVYLAGYAITQFIVFFFRGTVSQPITPFLGIDVLKQAQWTAIFVLIALIPYYFLLQRTSRPWTKAAAEALAAEQAAIKRQAEGAARKDHAEAAHAHSKEHAPEQHAEHAHEAHQTEERQAEPEATPAKGSEHERTEAADGAAHEGSSEHARKAAALEEFGATAQYTDAMAAELRTEGIVVSTPAAEEAAGAQPENGEAPARKPRTRTSGTGERGSRRGGRSAKKPDADE